MVNVMISDVGGNNNVTTSNIPNEAPIEVPQDPAMKDFINKLNK